MNPVRDLIARQVAGRYEWPDRVHVKVNLFRGYEVEPVLAGLGAISESDRVALDTVMVADSYLTTHLGYPSTSLDEACLQDLFFKVQLSTVVDVRRALDRADVGESVYLIFDMPHGSARRIDLGIVNAMRAAEYGADAVKIEVTAPEHVTLVEKLSSRDIPTVVHLGYSPQAGGPKLVGRTWSDAHALFAHARRCRDAGACALVLEGVPTVVLAALSARNTSGLPVYGIFSGHAPGAGQSINVWDAVYLPAFPARHFPPTATLEARSFPSSYTDAAIADHCGRLLDILGRGYPVDRPSLMSVDELAEIRSTNPWCP